jgi:glutamate synthase (NADPH/NADH) small chain
MMSEGRGFLKYKRQTFQYRPVCERVKDFKDVLVIPKAGRSVEQASRCMDCGTAFCNWGCPIGNYIPEWNDAVFKKQWQKAYTLLSITNNLPEITGRVCPAPCEYSCVLGINDDPVTIRENELSIIEHAFKNGLVPKENLKARTGMKVAVIGSGPAGLSLADCLNSAGHSVTVFEKDDLPGGILRYGIPDFKLEKHLLDRRLDLFKKRGIKFKTNTNVGVDVSAEELKIMYDAICLCCGSRVARDLNIPGRNLDGIYLAMDYLVQSNRIVADKEIKQPIFAKDKQVVIIGGGDTGADCVGVANRQGAKCVVQIELLPKPPECRSNDYPWPKYPMLLKTSSSHEEGVERKWQVLTQRFVGENHSVKALSCVRVEFPETLEKGCPKYKEVPGSEFEIPADIVILALGFLYPEKNIIEEFKIQTDARGNVQTDQNFRASVEGVFVAGDMHRGQSLVVWAIHEGRKCAEAVNRYLKGSR